MRNDRIMYNSECQQNKNPESRKTDTEAETGSAHVLVLCHVPVTESSSGDLEKKKEKCDVLIDI